MMALKVWIGYDAREQDAYNVCERSLRKHASCRLSVQPLMLNHLRATGLYTRPTSMHVGDGEAFLWDEISQAPMATEFALSRFAVPCLTDEWALFCDCDFLFRADISELLDYRDERFAVLCVPLHYQPTETAKMDGQRQLNYVKKGWSSFCLWNGKHLKHAGQNERVNRWPGLWLHQFRWLDPVTDIGALPAEWNVMDTGEQPSREPKAYHMTRGVPSMVGYGEIPFAGEWRSYL